MSIKRYLAALLSLLLLFSFVSCQTSEGTDETSVSESTAEATEAVLTDEVLKESPVEDFEYAAFSTDEISFENETYSVKDCVYIKKYIGNRADVVIPQTIDNKTVIGIGSYAFSGTPVERIVIADTVELTGNNAFEGAEKLVEVHGGASLRRIGEKAFYQCSSLERVDLSSDSMKVIGKSAFMYCQKLVDVKLGTNITMIADEAFLHCTSLQTITIPPSVTYFGERAFAGDTALSEVVLEEGLQTLGTSYLPFTGCTSLKTITFPASFRDIDDYYFSYTGLTQVFFKGDAPNVLGSMVFEDGVSIYYDPQTSGWDTTSLKDMYTLVPIS